MKELQADLMDEGLLEHILILLKDTQVEVGVRYFAGGILAHLTSKAEAWTLDQDFRDAILKQLVCVWVFFFFCSLSDNRVKSIHLIAFFFFYSTSR